ncbi:MAG: hypothetical protein CSA86_01400 [Arcobacter sp.]|nr:MAG: hypothetical protein CSA86_01400 [Arcobacter sp.]
MLSNFTIDTGTPRSITGHFISGVIATSIISGAINYKKYKNGEISKSESINDTIKTSLQGGIATAGAIATTNYIGEGRIIQAMASMSIAATGVYGTEKIYDKLELEVNKKKELENAK